jgi:hypothetical protein
MASVDAVCVTCGAARAGPFCSQCGQRSLAGRHTLRGFAAGALRRAIGDDGAFLTAKELAVRPGDVIRNYLAGQTVRYVNPVTYFLLAAALFTIVGRSVSGSTGASDSDKVFTFLVIPFVAGASRVFHWRGAYNYAEHLIAVVYLAAQTLLLLAILYPFTLLLPKQLSGSFAASCGVLAVIYFVWGYSRIFKERPWLAAIIGVLALVSGAVVWLVVTAGIVAALRQ